jgi:hypothetical protein
MLSKLIRSIFRIEAMPMRLRFEINADKFFGNVSLCSCGFAVRHKLETFWAQIDFSPKADALKVSRGDLWETGGKYVGYQTIHEQSRS